MTELAWNVSGYGVIEFAAPEFSVMENATFAYLTLTRTGGGFGRVSADFLAYSGTTRTIDADFVSRFGRARFLPYSYESVFAVEINDDEWFGRLPFGRGSW